MNPTKLNYFTGTSNTMHLQLKPLHVNVLCYCIPAWMKQCMFWHHKQICRTGNSFKWINQLDAAINYRFIVCRSYGKPEAAAAVDRLLMMGIRMPETCWAVS